MSKIVRLDESEFYLNTTPQNIMSNACIHKKRNGKYPDWYIKNNNGDVLVDVNEYDRYTVLERKAWLLATNDLYYLLTYDYGCTDTQISRFMARHSKKFCSKDSWSSFITKTLFSLPRESVIQKKLSMTIEFAVSGTYMLKLLMERENINLCNAKSKGY